MCICICVHVSTFILYSAGYYLYTEASKYSYKDTTHLTSPIETLNETHCLKFYVHMRGSSKYMGTLSLHRRVLTRPILRRPLFSISGNWKNKWLPITIEIPGGDTQLVFEGKRGRSSKGDMALDEISLESGRCNKSE